DRADGDGRGGRAVFGCAEEVSCLRLSLVVARSPDRATALDRRSPLQRGRGDLRSAGGAPSGDLATTIYGHRPLLISPIRSAAKILLPIGNDPATRPSAFRAGGTPRTGPPPRPARCLDRCPAATRAGTPSASPSTTAAARPRSRGSSPPPSASCRPAT